MQVICKYSDVGNVNDQACQKWLSKFYARDFSMNDALWLRSSVEVEYRSNEDSISYVEAESQHPQNIQSSI